MFLDDERGHPIDKRKARDEERKKQGMYNFAEKSRQPIKPKRRDEDERKKESTKRGIIFEFVTEVRT